MEKFCEKNFRFISCVQCVLGRSSPPPTPTFVVVICAEVVLSKFTYYLFMPFATSKKRHRKKCDQLQKVTNYGASHPQ
jgi:hypothetical protein